MADAPTNTLTISFPEEAYKLLAHGNAADQMNYQSVILNVNYFEDVRDEKARKAEAPPEIVARSIRLPLNSPGISTVVLGKPEDEKLSMSLLKSDGSALQTETVLLDENKAKYVITITDINNLAKAEVDPIEPNTKRTTRNAQLVPIGSVTPDFKKSKLAIFTVNKETDIAANSALGAFGFSKERTSSVELDPTLAMALQAVTWDMVALGIDGRFIATFDQPISKPGGDAEKSLGWVWWLSGVSSAAGFVKDDVSKFGRTPTIIPLPAMQPIPGTGAEAGDCVCDTPIKQVPLDVTEAELVNNPDVYAEDPGTFCKPFSNPNRVISEKAFAVVSRVDTPDISPLPSAHLRSTHLLDLEPDGQVSVGTDPSGGRIVVMQPPTKELLMSALLGTNMPKRYKEPVAIVQQTKQMPSGRTDVTAEQPVQWEDDVAQYQAATVALGHILEFRMRTRAAGYSLGNVASTLTLAPRQTKRIQKVEFERVERARREESTQQADSVNDTVTSERDYNDTVAAYLSEWSTGSSSSGTAAAAGGFGFCIPPVVGGAGGGTSKAWSDSSQEGSRHTGASEQQRLRDAIRRHGDALRRFQSTVVSEVTQQETVTGTTEVLRNVNYGHSLTVIYYQILRHLKVSTEFAGVRECLYVPFAIKPFTLQRAYRWREAIQKYLRIPRFNKVMTHLRDVITEFKYSSMAPGTRAHQRLTYLRGSFYITLAIERPKDTDDGKYNAAQWLPYSTFFGMPAYGIWAKMAEKAESLRDQLFQREHAPTIAAKWTDKLRLEVNGKPVDADLTLASRYGFNQSVRVDFNVPSDVADNYTREQLRDVVVRAAVPLPPGSVANVSRMTIRYGTANFQRTIEALSGLDDLIIPETGKADDRGAHLAFPLDAWDNVNEREVLCNSVNEFIEHLNEHVEFYHKAIWWNMDRDRLFMMLDGFYVPGSRNVSIASVVDREPIAIMGNSLVYRVGAGHFIGLPKITTPTELYNLYAGREPAQDDMRISLPTDGLYAQTIMDECLALEEHQGSVDWVLDDPDPELGTIDPSLMGSRRTDVSSTVTPTQMPGTIINLQNAPEAPAPTGLGAALTAVGNANAFRDMAGLAGTQANAAAALQTAASLATNFGNQAAALKMAEMAAKAQATQNVNQQLAAVQKAKDQDLISADAAAEHTNSILGQMHTTGQNKPYEDPVLAEAIANASGQPGSVIESTTADGQVRVEMNDKESTYKSKNVAIDPWDFQPTFWFMDASAQQRYPTPECAADRNCIVDKQSFEVKMVPLPPNPPAPAPPSSWKLDLKTTGTGKVAMTIEQRYATINALLPTTDSAHAIDTLQLIADTLNAVRTAIADVFSAVLPSGTGGPTTDDGARALQCLASFSATAPVNVMLVDTQEFVLANARLGVPIPSVTPVTTKVWVNLSDIGNTALLEPAMRFTTDLVMGRNGQAQISKLSLCRAVLHELLHIRLYRDNTGMEQAWALARPKLAPVGSVNGNDLGERLVWHFLMAQEEMFVYNFVDRTIPFTKGKATSIIASYAKWRDRAKNCFLTHGATMNTQSLNIPVSFKVGAKKVTWSIDFEFPSGYNFTDKDMPGLDRVIDDFQKIS